MFGLFQNTPQYAGEGQPGSCNSSGGALGLLSGLFTFSSTPNYAIASTDGAPTGAAIYAPAQTGPAATSEQLAVPPDCRVPLPVAIVIQRSDQCQ